MGNYTEIVASPLQICAYIIFIFLIVRHLYLNQYSIHFIVNLT